MRCQDVCVHRWYQFQEGLRMKLEDEAWELRQAEREIE